MSSSNGGDSSKVMVLFVVINDKLCEYQLPWSSNHTF